MNGHEGFVSVKTPVLPSFRLTCLRFPMQVTPYVGDAVL